MYPTNRPRLELENLFISSAVTHTSNGTHQGELLPAVLRLGERTSLGQTLPRLGEAEGAVLDEGVDLHLRRLGQVGVLVGREPGVERVV